MQLVYATLNDAIRQSTSFALISPTTHEPFSDTDRVRAAVSLMLLAG